MIPVSDQHRELVRYVEAMARAHPDWTSGRIARAAAKVFYEDVHFRPGVAARIELSAKEV